MLEKLADGLWMPWLLGLFLAVGCWCTLTGRFFPLLHGKTWLKELLFSLKRPKKREKGLTQTQALATALASTVGTGSVAGVAVALTGGGPGAILWMWVSALLGLSISFVEKSMAVKYRERGPVGGPMVYMEKRLGWRAAARWFSLWCVLASFTSGALVQSNSVSAALHAALGWNRGVVGLVTALCAGAVLVGGMGRVGRVSERLVPLMALLYLGGGTAVIFAHRQALPAALGQIFRQGLCPQGLGLALRYGVARGVFTNEAGVGSSAIAHAAADTDSPVREGFWGMFETGFATLVVCTVTALALLTAGVTGQEGAALVGLAFATALGSWGPLTVALCLLLFAFTSLLGWCCYGERGLDHLAGRRFRPLYRVLYLLAVWAGSVGGLGQVWALSDLSIGFMALPNLLALAVLAPEGWEDLRRGEKGSILNAFGKKEE